MASLFQFSIRTLLVAVTIAAIGIAALLNANVWWEAATWLVALGLLAIGILLCVYRRDQQRAYWLGFVIFGGLYLGLILFTALIDRHYELATSQVMQLAYQKVIPAERQSEYTQPPGTTLQTAVTTAYTYQVLATPQTGTVTYSPPPPTMPAPAPVAYSAPPNAWPYSPANWVTNPSFISPFKFISIGHSLWLLVAAAIGGKICQWIYRTQSPRRDSSAKEQPQP
jgi:hypothetical protein